MHCGHRTFRKGQLRPGGWAHSLGGGLLREGGTLQGTHTHTHTHTNINTHLLIILTVQIVCVSKYSEFNMETYPALNFSVK